MKICDSTIVNKCKDLKKLSLTDNDRLIVSLIESQFEDNWRTPLLKMLDKISNKYE